MAQHLNIWNYFRKKSRCSMNNNNTIYKIEMKKAICNRGFIITITIGMILAVLSLIYWINLNTNQKKLLSRYTETVDISYNPDVTSDILFNRWIGSESGSLGSVVYFFVFPLLIVLPFGWSFAAEMKNGYSKMVIVKCGRMKYFYAKYLAMFTSAGLAMIIPMIFSIAITACFYPAITPFVMDDVYYGVFDYSLFADLYYTRPFLYLVLYLLIDFCICGLLACLCMTISMVLRQKYLVMVVPMLVCLGIEYTTKYVYDLNSYYNYEISPLYYLKPMEGRLPANGRIIFLSGVILFIITFVLTGIWEKKHEIY